MKKKTKKSESEVSLEKFLDDFIAKNGGDERDASKLLNASEDLFKLMKKKFYERALQGEMNHHLGYRKGDNRPEGQDNLRNGTSTKKLVSADSSVEIDIPRDRAGEFDPIIIEKNKRRLPRFDEKVLYLYAQGVSQRDIASQLEEFYQVSVSQELISEVTDQINEEVTEWRNRPLDEVYPILYLDALVAKVKGPEGVANRAVYVALGVNMEGQKEVLGLWLGENEGAKFWLRVLTELQNRGLRDIFIACVDGLCGFAEAIESVYPQTRVQSCIVHAVRNSLKFVGWKERKKVAEDLKLIYQSSTREQAEQELANFRAKWDDAHPIIGEQWERNWDKLAVLFDYPADIRRAIYTTNAIESLNHTMRKVLKNRKAFHGEQAIMKVLYLAIVRASKKWTMPIRNWGAALQRFSIEFAERMPNINNINL